MPGLLTCPAKIMQCFVYILKNNRGKHYIGITKLPIDKRLERHNNGDVFSTRAGRPWKIVYLEKYDNYITARSREKQIKSWHGGNAFKKLISSAAGSSNGRTADSGSAYLGSNPSPAALGIRNKFGGLASPNRRGE